MTETERDYRAGADADNLSALERELGWAMKQSCYDGLYGTDEDRARSRAIEDTLRSRVRTARKLEAINRNRTERSLVRQRVVEALQDGRVDDEAETELRRLSEEMRELQQEHIRVHPDVRMCQKHGW